MRGEEYVLINSHLEFGGALTKIVGQYLLDILSRYGHRSTDLRMTLVVVSNWNECGVERKKGLSQQKLDEIQNTIQECFEWCATHFPLVRVISIGPTEYSFWNRNKLVYSEDNLATFHLFFINPQFVSMNK